MRVIVIVLAGLSHILLVTWLLASLASAVPPEAELDVPELIRYNGYPCEEHIVQTPDKYLLGLQRIPHGNADRQKVFYKDGLKPVVFLQHGLLMCSACWVENPPDISLGFLLADHGFDVWLGNVRGNTYSRRHVTLRPTQDKFWEFSWDEMVTYDLPSMINYVLGVSKANDLYYVGHSQGTEIGFAGFSNEWNSGNKIKMFFALAPVAYLGNIGGPLGPLAPLGETVLPYFSKNGELLPHSDMLSWLSDYFCKSEVMNTCENIVLMIGGYDPEQLDSNRIPVYMAHHPAGTSVQNVNHYAQSVLHGRFQMYDYGLENNMEKYHQDTPPLYDASLMNTPVVLYTGDKDLLADPADVKLLIPELPNLVEIVNIPEYEHLDFVWAMNAPEKVYNDIINKIHAQTEHNILSIY